MLAQAQQSVQAAAALAAVYQSMFMFMSSGDRLDNPIFTGGKNQRQYRKMVASNPHLRKSKKYRKSN